MSVMLRVLNLVIGYGLLFVLNGVDISVDVGEVVVVFGVNGVGKLMLLCCLLGLFDFLGDVVFLN